MRSVALKQVERTVYKLDCFSMRPAGRISMGEFSIRRAPGGASVLAVVKS